MSENTDPKTGLPVVKKSKFELMEDALNTEMSKENKTVYNKRLKLSKEMLGLSKEVNIDDYLEGGKGHNKQLIDNSEYTLTGLDSLGGKYQDRLNQSIKDRTNQLHADQGILDRGAKAVAKFAGKTIGNVVGGLAGTVYGAGRALFTFDTSNFYEGNHIFDALDGYNEFVDENTVIQGSYGYHDKGFLEKIASDPSKLFLDEGSNAASFVAGAVLTELLTAGLGTGAVGVQAGRLGASLGKATGISKLGAASKGMKMAKGLDMTAETSKVMKAVDASGKAKDYLGNLKKMGGTARGLAMGSGYEAALEARENHDLVLESLMKDYETKHGSEATGEELKKLDKIARDASEYVFYGNMALVGGSNLLQFPKIFWKGYKGQNRLMKGVDRALTGSKKAKFKLDEAGNVITKGPGKYAKPFVYGYKALKSPVREGLEEVSQGILNESVLDYHSKKYSPLDNKEAVSVIQSLMHATHGSMGKEGGNQFGMGFLMGLVGLPGMKMKTSKKTGKQTIGVGLGAIGGSVNEVMDYRAEQKANEDMATKANEAGSLSDNIKANFENYAANTVIQQELDEAIASGDVFRFKNLENDQFYSYVRARQKVGQLDAVKADLENLRDNISTEEFNKDFGMPEVASFTEQGKQEAIEKALEFVNKVESNSKIVEEALEREGIANPGEEVIEELVHAASVLDNVDQREKELTEKVTELTGDRLNPYSISTYSKEKAKEYPSNIRRESLNKLILTEDLLAKKRKAKNQKLSKAEQKELDGHLNDLLLKEEDVNEYLSNSKSDFSNIREKVGETQVELTPEGKVKMSVNNAAFDNEVNKALETWKEEDPVRYTKHKGEVADMLSDIAKLKNRREEFISYYNHLFTPEGIEQFEEMSKAVIEEYIKNDTAETVKAAKEAKTAQEQADIKKQAEEQGGTVADKVNDTLNKKNTEKSVEAGVMDTTPSKLANNIEDRYRGNNELWEAEKALMDQNAEILGLPDDISTPEELAEHVRTLQVEELDIQVEVIRDFYNQVGDSVYLNTKQGKEGGTVTDSSNEDGTTTTTNPVEASAMITNLEYELVDGVVQYDESGHPIKAKSFSGMTKEDNDFVNSPNGLKVGDQVSLTIDASDTYKDNAQDIKIKVTTVKNGKTFTLGLVPTTAKGPEFTDIREALYKQYKESGGTVTSAETYTIDNKLAGRFLNTSSTTESFDNLQNPTNINEENQVKSNTGELLLGLGVAKGNVTVLEVPNSNVKVPSSFNVTPGRLYTIIKGANGEMMPVALKTRQITAEEVDEVVNIIGDLSKGTTKEELNEASDKIFAIAPVVVKKVGTQLIIYKKSKDIKTKKLYRGHINNINDAETLAKIKGILGEQLKNISSEALNIGGNDIIFENDVRTNINTKTPVVNANFTINVKTNTPKIAKTTKATEVKHVGADGADAAAVAVSPKSAPKPKSATAKRKRKALPKSIAKRTKLSTKKYTKWDKKEELAWLAKNLPSIDVKVLKDLQQVAGIDHKDVWGLFTSAGIYLKENAGAGTAYHEAFHAVFNLMLAEKERTALLNKAQSTYGLNDDIALEEMLADEFADYMLAQKGKPVKQKTWLRQLFDRIMRVLNVISTKNTTVDSIFSEIAAGNFSKVGGNPIKRNVKKFESTNRFKLVDFNPLEKNERVNMVVHDIIEAIQDEEITNANKPAIKEFLEEIYADTIEQYKEESEYFLKEYGQETYDYVLDQYAKVLDNLDEILELSLFKLPSYGYVVGKTTQEAIEADTSMTTKEGWQTSVYEKSSKDTTTKEVKQKLARINKKKGDSIGAATFYGYDEIFNTLKSKLSGSLSFQEMREILESESSNLPYIDEVLSMIDGNPLFRAGFFSSMANQTANFALLLTSVKEINIGGRTAKERSHKVISSNRKSPEKVVINDWNSNFFNKAYKKGDIDTGYTKPLVKNVLDNLKLLDNKMSTAVNPSVISQTVQSLGKLGIDFDSETLTRVLYKGGKINLKKLNEFKDAFEIIGNSMNDGNNPFMFEGGKGEKSHLNTLAKEYTKYNLQVFETSSKNVENKTVFSQILPNHISKLTSDLVKDNKTIEWYQKDKFYQKNFYLNALKQDRSKNLFKISILDGFKDSDNDKGVKYTQMSEADLTELKLHMFSNQANVKAAHYPMPILADAPQQVFVQFHKFTNKEALGGLYQVALQEFARNKDLQTSEYGIKEYTAKHVYMPFLKGLSEKDMLDAKKVKSLIYENLLAPEITKSMAQFDNMGLGVHTVDKEGNHKFKFAGKKAPHGTHTLEKTMDFISNYTYNSVLANYNLSQIYSGDLAFYKGMENFAKRNKQINNPGRMLDTTEIGETYKTLFIEGTEVPSVHKEAYAKALEGNPKKAAILAQYNEVDATDAQAYVSIERYRDVLKGLGQWTQEHEDSFDSIKKGTANPSALSLFLQPIKPFYFGKIEVTDQKGENPKIVPMQNKNSEYLLIKQVADGNPKLEKLFGLMNPKNGDYVDSIQFTTAVKVGQHKATTFEELDVKNSITLNNRDYGIQLEVPEHHVDTKNLFGTQIRKLIISDLLDGAAYNTATGVEMNKEELFEKYQDIISEDIQEPLNELLDLFEDDANLAEVLLKEAQERDMGSEYTKILELDENGKFKYPLFTPMNAKKNEALLNSLFNNRVIKGKIRGASMVQVSDFGLSESLKVVMSEDGKSLKHVEAVMPHYSKKYFEPFMDENGEIDIAKIEKENPELLEAISYRIPTEDKYSMLPIKIKGFAPQIAGGTIMLPADITAITGADFDIDKMFLMFNSFKVNEEGKVEYVKYDHSKPAKGQSKAARDNAKIDIIRGILTNPNTFENWITPGGFERWKGIRSRLVAKKKAENEDYGNELNIGLPSSYLELFTRNMAGKNLIGMFANHNVTQAMFQYTDIAFLQPIRFDGREEMGLNNTHVSNSKGKKGERITRLLAEGLAAVVDNANEPLAGDMNINTFTADVLATMVRVGYPIETAIAFLNQPAIEKLTADYFNLGGTTTAKFKALADIREILTTKLNMDIKESQKRFWDTNLTTSSLGPAIGKKLNDLTEEELITQLVSVDKFMKILGQAEELNTLIQVMKVDSSGVGPTISDNNKMLSKLSKILESKTIDGSTVSDALEVYKSADKFIDVVKDTNEVLVKYFPWNQRIFKGVAETFETLKRKDLTVEEAELINYSTLSYVVSKFDFFNLDNQEYKRLVTKAPLQIKEKLDTLDKEMILPKVIKLVETAGLNTLEFNTNSKLSTVQKDQITAEIEYLHSKAEYKDMIEDLVKYSFAVSGVRYTPNSFNHLLPTSLLDSLTDKDGVSYGKFLMDLNDTSALESTLSEGALEGAEKEEEAFYMTYEQVKGQTSTILESILVNNFDKFGNIIPSVGELHASDLKVNEGLVTSLKLDSSDLIISAEGKAPVYVKRFSKGKNRLYKFVGKRGNSATHSQDFVFNIVPTKGMENKFSEINANTEGSVFESNHLKLKVGEKSITISENVEQNKKKLLKEGLEYSDYFFEESEGDSIVADNLDTTEKGSNLADAPFDVNEEELNESAEEKEKNCK